MEEELSLMAVLELIRNLNADSSWAEDGPRQALYRLNGSASSPGSGRAVVHRPRSVPDFCRFLATSLPADALSTQTLVELVSDPSPPSAADATQPKTISALSAAILVCILTSDSLEEKIDVVVDALADSRAVALAGPASVAPAAADVARAACAVTAAVLSCVSEAAEFEPTRQALVERVVPMAVGAAHAAVDDAGDGGGWSAKELVAASLLAALRHLVAVAAEEEMQQALIETAEIGTESRLPANRGEALSGEAAAAGAVSDTPVGSPGVATTADAAAANVEEPEGVEVELEVPIERSAVLAKSEAQNMVNYEEGLERQRNTRGLQRLVQDSLVRVLFVDLARTMVLVIVLAGTAAIAVTLYHWIGLATAIAIALACDVALALVCLLLAARSSEGRELMQLRPQHPV